MVQVAKSYAGFDTMYYPGDKEMAYLYGFCDLYWVCFYLGPTPAHTPADWMPKREYLQSLRSGIFKDKKGWGLAATFLGHQTTGPGQHLPTDTVQASKIGIQDANLAVDLMGKAGFLKGSYVYLDVENGRPYQQYQKNHILMWYNRILELGYLPGIYCSFTQGTTVQALCPKARIWVWHVKTLQKSTHGEKLDYPEPDPSTSGFTDATMWQLAMNCDITVPRLGKKITVDFDSSTIIDPSAGLVQITPGVAPKPLNAPLFPNAPSV